MLQRIVFVVLALFVLWRLLTAHGRRIHGATGGADRFSRYGRRGRDRFRQDEIEPREDLVACAACGTLVPTTRVRTTSDGRPACSDACREAISR